MAAERRPAGAIAGRRALETRRRASLAQAAGIGVFVLDQQFVGLDLRMPQHFAARQHRRMRRRARGYEAVVVLGCESAKVSVERALEGMNCRVVIAMELTGLTNAVAKFQLPLTIDLAEKALVEG